jgi:hypothetical protein
VQAEQVDRGPTESFGQPPRDEAAPVLDCLLPVGYIDMGRAAVGAVHTSSADIGTALPIVRFAPESVAKLGQCAVDHLKWAIIESARAVS